MGDSNSRHPKSMSVSSNRTFVRFFLLSVAPAVPLWNSFALFASGTIFVFWDLCGIEFCILKVLPTGFAPRQRVILPLTAAQKLRRINKEISADVHSRLPLGRAACRNAANKLFPVNPLTAMLKVALVVLPTH